MPDLDEDTEEEIMGLLASGPMDQAATQGPDYLEEENRVAGPRGSRFLELRDEDLPLPDEEPGGVISAVLAPWRALPDPVRLVLGSMFLFAFLFGVVYPVLMGPGAQWLRQVMQE